MKLRKNFYLIKALCLSWYRRGESLKNVAFNNVIQQSNIRNKMEIMLSEVLKWKVLFGIPCKMVLNAFRYDNHLSRHKKSVYSTYMSSVQNIIQHSHCIGNDMPSFCINIVHFIFCEWDKHSTFSISKYGLPCFSYSWNKIANHGIILSLHGLKGYKTNGW